MTAQIKLLKLTNKFIIVLYIYRPVGNATFSELFIS